LIASWGTPTRSKSEREEGRLLLYKMKFFEGFEIVPGHHVALSIDGPYPVAGIYISVPSKPEPRIVGKLKVRFRADEDGTIVDVQVLYLNWVNSNRSRPEISDEEPIEPKDRFKADVDVDPD